MRRGGTDGDYIPVTATATDSYGDAVSGATVTFTLQYRAGDDRDTSQSGTTTRHSVQVLTSGNE
ncbi:hypothetical protein JC200_12495 [Alicyclobacillus sp. ALC3]|nr:hypothetical protein JC200_12495 [Alicyclobacillus sp. ALC3]